MLTCAQRRLLSESLLLAACLAVISSGCKDGGENRSAAGQGSAAAAQPKNQAGLEWMSPSSRYLVTGGNRERRWLAIQCLAETPQGREFFRSCLGSPQGAVRLLGLEGAGGCRSFKLIPILGKAALSRGSEARGLYYAKLAMSNIIGTPYPMMSSPENIGQQKHDLLLLIRSSRRIWAVGTYVEYWSGIFDQAAARWNKGGGGDPATASELFDGLLLSWERMLSVYLHPRRNVDAALDRLPPALKLAIPPSGSGMSRLPLLRLRRTLYADMIWRLQLVLGPILPFPKDADGHHWRTNVRALRKWWEAHRNDRRSQWLLSSLAIKGYRTGHPAHARRTLKALIAALGSDSLGGLDRAAAAEVLNESCPKMPAIVVPPAVMLARRSNDCIAGLEVDAMYHESITAAIVWYLRYAARVRWEPHLARYVILPRREIAPPLLQRQRPCGGAKGFPPGGR